MPDFLNREAIGTRMQFDRGNRKLYVDGIEATRRTDITKLPSDEQVAFVNHFAMNIDEAMRHCGIEPHPKTPSHTHPDPTVEAQRAKLRYGIG